MMEIGDIVRRKDGRELRSGSCAYGAAIVVSVEPFILVSQHADMRWSATVEPSEFNVSGKATNKQLTLAKTRLKN